MLKRTTGIGGLLFKPDARLVGLIVPGFFLLLISMQVYGEVPVQRQAEIIHMLEHDCGSCHGLKLRGGLGPPLTTDSLQSKNADELIRVVTYGVPHTPMPPWQGLLEDNEIAWLVNLLLSGVPASQYVPGDEHD